MKAGRTISIVAAVFAPALSASVAFAHAGEEHGGVTSEGLGWLVSYGPPLFAPGGIALVGVVYFATRPREQ